MCAHALYNNRHTVIFKLLTAPSATFFPSEVYTYYHAFGIGRCHCSIDTVYYHPVGSGSSYLASNPFCYPWIIPVTAFSQPSPHCFVPLITNHCLRFLPSGYCPTDGLILIFIFHFIHRHKTSDFFILLTLVFPKAQMGILSPDPIALIRLPKTQAPTVPPHLKLASALHSTNWGQKRT